MTGRQRRFVEEYLVDLNGKAAAIRAGYAPRSAKKSAWNNLGSPAVAAAIAERQAKRLGATLMRAEEALRELAAIVRGNALDYLRPDAKGGPALDLAGLDRPRATALGEVRVEAFAEGRGADRRAGRRIHIRMRDKIAALDRLAKHCGFYRGPSGRDEPERAPPTPAETRAAAWAVLDLMRGTDGAAVEIPERFGGSIPDVAGTPTTAARAEAAQASRDNALTRRQALFVAEYLVDLNGTQAAIRAGYSARWAKEIGWQTLGRPAVAAAIGRAQAERLAAAGIGRADLLGALTAIGRANLIDYVQIDRDGEPAVDLSRLDRARGAALREVVVEAFEEGGTRRVRIRMHDKLAALDRLARHHGLYREGSRLEAAADAARLHSNRQVARAVLALMREAQTGDGGAPDYDPASPISAGAKS